MPRAVSRQLRLPSLGMRPDPGMRMAGQLVCCLWIRGPMVARAVGCRFYRGMIGPPPRPEATVMTSAYCGTSLVLSHS